MAMAFPLGKRAAELEPAASTERQKADRKRAATPVAADVQPKRTSRTSECAVPPPEPPDRGIAAPPYRPVKNPQATLTGLPAELRLRIYSHLGPTMLIHIHQSKDDKPRFTWSHCKGTHPDYPLLCANPAWSGLCAEDDRCSHGTDVPNVLHGLSGLAVTSKLIRHEIQDFFKRKTVYSIHEANFFAWMKHATKYTPNQLRNIRYLNLAGVQWDWGWVRSWDWTGYGPDPVPLKYLFPNLEGVAFQLQSSYAGSSEGSNSESEDSADSWWTTYGGNVLERYDLDMKWSITIEGFRYLKRIGKEAEVGGKAGEAAEEQQLILRLQRDAKSEGYKAEYWDSDDIKFKLIEPKGLAEPSRTAPWRSCIIDGYSLVGAGHNKTCLEP